MHRNPHNRRFSGRHPWPPGGRVVASRIGPVDRSLTVAALIVFASAAAFAQKPAPAYDTSKLEPGLYAVIHTSMGTIAAELYEKVAPITVRNFIALARGTRQWLDPKTHQPVTRPLYDNLIFHRVIPDFMIQTGDPTGTGGYNCGFTLPDEIGPLRFDQPGRLAMANKGPNTGDCQFFITEVPTPWLNGKHTIFGQVVDGQNVANKIANVIRDSNDKPRFPIKLVNVEVLRVAPRGAESRLPTVTGPGLFVNTAGDVLTAYSVVQGCSELRLKDGGKLQLAYSDGPNNLALLHSDKKPTVVATIGENAVQLGPARLAAGVITGFLEANNVPYQKQSSSGSAESVEVQCWK
ncbi:MAG: peptidylprolyl isomerase [Acidobacteriia bacterium]|nr:peptidylprolyl isomerase [Terriglobia bacterium]